MSPATTLQALGFRAGTKAQTAQAIRDFQASWNLGAPLKVDGIAGPKTTAALSISEGRRRKGQSTLSAHFSYAEFACRCGGRSPGCHGVLVDRRHVARLETYRDKIGGPVTVVSGYRCPAHNKAVGGASSSQHMYGVATDIRGAVTPTKLKGWGLFAGLGFQASTNLVIHVDSRDISANNTTHSSTRNPAQWRYA